MDRDERGRGSAPGIPPLIPSGCPLPGGRRSVTESAAAECDRLAPHQAPADARVATGAVADAVAATGASSRPAMRRPRRWYVGASNAA
jgi:hypothetical protein